MLKLVNFTQYYIGGNVGGKINATTWNSSFHGYGEVIGDRYQLCARSLDSTPHFDKWLAFESCVNGVDGIGGVALIPGNSEKCARDAGIGWEELKECAEGAEGLKLFHDAVYHTYDQNVIYDFPPPLGEGGGIPVVHINGKKFFGLDAYKNLTARICSSAPAGMPCGCDEGLLEAGRRQAAKMQYPYTTTAV